MRLFVKKRRAMQENGVRFFRFPHSSELYRYSVFHIVIMTCTFGFFSPTITIISIILFT